MNTLSFDLSRIGISLSDQIIAEAIRANELIHNGQGPGNDMLGWVTLPSSTSEEELCRIEKEAARLRALADVIICIGIGGSYLGARAVYEALQDPFQLLHRQQDTPILLFAGQNLSEDYHARLLQAVEERSIAVIAISKSGTTTEPAIAFRLFREELERRYGRKEAARRIVAVTDHAKGALKTMADREGYTTFAIPDNVGGRYSVLTPVGLLPLATAGIDIRALLDGARLMELSTATDRPFAENPAACYAAVRNMLYRQGFNIEILATYEPQLQYFTEWWKQLFGESEGQQGRGIFPTSTLFSTDLHSLGQYIQEGERNLFETVISVKNSQTRIVINPDRENLDGLNYLSGKRLSEINHTAESGVCIAHVEGGVPNLRVRIPEISARTLGALIYFFEKACGISGYLLGINPFDQPGVEVYKKKMFALLNKPGYEKISEELRSEI